MRALKAALVGMGLLVLGGCAVYEPYPVAQAYPSYPAYPPAVVVQPHVYGYWGGYWGGGGGGHRHWGGHGHRHWGGHGRHWR